MVNANKLPPHSTSAQMPEIVGLPLAWRRGTSKAGVG
jgi:hypothetical protein